MNDKRLPYMLAWVVVTCFSFVLFFTNERAFFFWLKAMGMASTAFAPIAYFWWKDTRPTGHKES